MKDKILFWLGVDYTNFCLAYSLQQKIDCEMYAIIDVTKKPRTFFETQHLVDFKNIWFFHDQIKKKSFKPDLEYLRKFEKKYKINLWQLVQNERIFLYPSFHKFSNDETLQILEQECRFFEKILDEIKPDYFFTKLASFHHLELFFQMCKNTNTKVQAINFGLLGQNCIITQEHEKLDMVEDFEHIETKNRNFDSLQKFMKSFDLTKQLENNTIAPSRKTQDQISASTEYFLKSDSGNTETHYPYYGRTKIKVFFYYLKDLLRTKKRKSYVDKNLIKNPPYDDAPFVYFPLHLEMERTLLISAPYFTNQLEVIRNIAQSLPINFKLFVKEHPLQLARGWRSPNEYREIMKIPNVTLLHPSVDKNELYQKCSLIITIAGSAGFEGLFYGKPVITFIDLNFSLLNSVDTITNLAELPKMIENSLSKKIDPSDLDRFVTLLEKSTTNFDYADFLTKFKKEFFYNGNLVDVEIPETKMKSFLEKNGVLLDTLADAHIKKINWFKEKKSFDHP